MIVIHVYISFSTLIIVESLIIVSTNQAG